MSRETGIDQAKLDAFTETVASNIDAAYLMPMVAIGDRLDLFKDLAAHGPATSSELSTRTGLDERYLREWLAAMACARWLDYEPATGRFALPPEHALVLADEGGPYFLGGEYQALPAVLGVLDPVARAFRSGGGTPYDGYGGDWWVGFERTRTSFAHLLVQEWIPTMPEVRSALERGVDVADVGCGSGRALINLALAFPRSRFVGYDIFEPQIELAAANAAAAGVADRIRFETRDIAADLPDRFDVVTTFDVVHDTADPLGFLRAIRAILRPGGMYVMQDIKTGERLEDNIEVGSLAASLYSISVLFCMTTSLAQGGAGLGTQGLPESKVRQLCRAAGFGDVRRLPIEHPVNVLYEIAG